MTTTQIAIVGAGPAGAIAAQRLASRGVAVCLLDKATFPRDKICGDGVMGDGLAILERTGLADWATQFPAIRSLRISSPAGQVLDISLNHATDCVGCLIPRRQLDAALVEAATKAGAQLMEGTRVTRIETSDRALIITKHESITADLVIIAEGSHATLTRRLGLIHARPELYAMRQYLQGLTGGTDLAGQLEVHFRASIVPGYTWLFPIGNNIFNIGTGTYSWRLRQKEINLAHELANFKTDPLISEKLAQAAPLDSPKSYPLRTRITDTQTHAARILVAGDAAGLVSPFTGEGIANAMHSGELAAHHAVIALQQGDCAAKALAPYSRALNARFKADQWGARMLRRVLTNPKALKRVFTNLQQDAELAQLFGYIFVDKVSPRRVLRPLTLMKLLR